MPDLGDYHWELYNVDKDYSENNDLAAQMPDKLKEMQALFLTEAAKYNVLPLDNSGFVRVLTPQTERDRRENAFSPIRVRKSAFLLAMPRAFWTRTIPSPPT